MNIHSIMDLDFVVDDFKEGEHEKLDANVPQFLSAPPLSVDITNMAFILLFIVEQLGDRGHPRYRGSLFECQTLINRNPRICDMISAGWKDGYKRMRLLSKDLSASADSMSNATFDCCVIEILRKEDKPPQSVQHTHAERTGSESQLFLIPDYVSDYASHSR